MKILWHIGHKKKKNEKRQSISYILAIYFIVTSRSRFEIRRLSLFCIFSFRSSIFIQTHCIMVFITFIYVFFFQLLVLLFMDEMATTCFIYVCLCSCLDGSFSIVFMLCVARKQQDIIKRFVTAEHWAPSNAMCKSISFKRTSLVFSKYLCEMLALQPK